MLVLGIETSCDESGVALVELAADGRATVVGEVLASQVDLHARYGGVVPELASREHMRALPLLCEELWSAVNCSIDDVGLVGVTCGPGLKGCLLIGATFAQGLVLGRKIPLMEVNHIEGHILSAELHHTELRAPYLSLVVSGGHTELVLVEGVGRYTVLCRTRDDAAGEAFDKSAHLLGLAYPGGARLAALADTVGSSRFTLPRVAREFDDFSFSGLKTAVSLAIKKHSAELEADPRQQAEMAWAIQDAILDPLVLKTAREVKQRSLPLVVCGGVSANAELRKRLSKVTERLYTVPIRHCIDNGAMIAYTAARRAALGETASRPMSIRSRWPVEELS